MHTELPNRIKELREARGIKRHFMAVEFDVDPSTIWHWEHKGPPRDLIPRLAGYLDVSIDELMDWKPESA